MRFIKQRKIARPTKPKEEKTVAIRLIRPLFLALIAFLVLSGPIGYLKAKQMHALITNEQQALTKEIKQTLTVKQTKTQATSELFKQFLTPFIGLYMTVPNEQSAFEERQATLQEAYFSFTPKEAVNTGSERKLTSNSFYDVFIKDGQTVAQYQVAYEIISPVVKEKNGEGEEKETYTDYETSQHQTLLNIPFKAYPDGTFKVTSSPYFSSEPTLTAEKVLEEPLDKSTYTFIKNQQNQAIQDFVQTFLNKYVSTTTEEMAYLMKEPETLHGDYKIENIQTENFAYDNQFLSFVIFEVYDNGTKSFHTETMTLVLKQRDKTYFIEKMTHYLGGID